MDRSGFEGVQEMRPHKAPIFFRALKYREKKIHYIHIYSKRTKFKHKLALAWLVLVPCRLCLLVVCRIE